MRIGCEGGGGEELGVGKEKEGKGVKLTRSIRKKRNGGREGWMEGVRVEGSAQDRLERRYQRRGGREVDNLISLFNDAIPMRHTRREECRVPPTHTAHIQTKPTYPWGRSLEPDLKHRTCKFLFLFAR